MALTIARILHAGYQFSCDGVEILFDPIFENPFSRNCHAFPDVRFDLDAVRRLTPAAIFISHFHDDHCSFDSLDLLPRATPIYLYCLFGELFDMLRELGFHHVHALRIDTAVQVGPFTVTPREALDADVDAMFQVQADGINLLNVVDAWISDETVEQLASMGPWDMVLWPFQTMLEQAVLSPSRTPRYQPEVPPEFIAQLQQLNPRYVVPSSCQFVQEPWSWYNHAMFPMTYAQFRREVEAALPLAQVLRLNPSVAVTFQHGQLLPAPALAYVVPVGEQDIDFDYQPDIAAPLTADIARRFPSLSAEQSAVVHAFCQHELLERFRNVGGDDSGYFDQPRLWHLALYDHEGRATQLHYRVHGEHIEAVARPVDAYGWLTEVTSAKVYAALAHGESLSSMYVRVNDMQFDAATEAALDEADVLDDPLIRSLFNARFGAYQAAQLKRLMASRIP